MHLSEQTDIFHSNAGEPSRARISRGKLVQSIFRTIEAFPKGRTTEELIVLCGAAFQPGQRLAILAELDSLQQEGRAIKGRDGRWRTLKSAVRQTADPKRDGPSSAASEQEYLVAAPAVISALVDSQGSDEPVDLPCAQDDRLSPVAILRYWRSALRSDPRGRITTRPDLHRVDWHLIAGQGPVVQSDDAGTMITIDLDALGSEFRQALLRRDGEDAALAVGWPLAVGRKSGLPVVRPVGLFSATWDRLGGRLVVKIGDNDVLVNPDWLVGAAREMGWSRTELPEIFSSEEGAPLPLEDFLQRLREAAAGHVRGRLTGDILAAHLDPSSVGIHDAAALFLPGESSFTSRASADLDKITTWSEETLSQTALAPLLGLDWRRTDREVLPINLGPLNREQLIAVDQACRAPLCVVQGPPGTGKSQAIVSMAASVLMSGGSVLVASKNHQALDAVQDRLGGLAPELPFVVRTLDPANDIDTSFDDVLRVLIGSDSLVRGRAPDAQDRAALMQTACQRAEGLDRHDRRVALELRIAELHDRIVRSDEAGAEQEVVTVPSRGVWARFIAFLRRLLSGGDPALKPEHRPLATADLKRELDTLRTEKTKLGVVPDLLGLSDQIIDLARRLLPAVMERAVIPSEETRQGLAERTDIREISGDRHPMPGDLARAILRHRPLWLASVLGTGKRIPLEAGLFDLVIFDEASQCDIASAMPLFARAKRAVVVGDDRQLSFIPQLGLAQDRNLMMAQGLDPKRVAGMAQSRRSLFDCAQRVAEVPRVTLRHQYRSAGPIVDYISDNFYGGALVVAQPPGACVPKDGKPGLAWTDVPAPMVPGRNNVNSHEADAIAREVHRLLVEQSYQGTIGAISPFRGQVQTIQDAVTAKVPEHLLAAAEFRSATVDGFQGQERDLILFSPTLGSASPTTALTFVQKDKRRLNVAISRARAVAHVVGDLSFARTGKVRSLASLAAYATEPRKKLGEGVFDSEWEARVFDALRARGLDPKPQYDVAGRRLDFALFSDGGIKLDLEVDGRLWHQTAEGHRKTSDIWRDQQLKALGWRVRRFWVDELASNMEGCLDLVERDLS